MDVCRATQGHIRRSIGVTVNLASLFMFRDKQLVCVLIKNKVTRCLHRLLSFRALYYLHELLIQRVNAHAILLDWRRAALRACIHSPVNSQLLAKKVLPASSPFLNWGGSESEDEHAEVSPLGACQTHVTSHEDLSRSLWSPVGPRGF
jgi:hypothetical protein